MLTEWVSHQQEKARESALTLCGWCGGRFPSLGELVWMLSPPTFSASRRKVCLHQTLFSNKSSQQKYACHVNSFALINSIRIIINICNISFLFPVQDTIGKNSMIKNIWNNQFYKKFYHSIWMSKYTDTSAMFFSDNGDFKFSTDGTDNGNIDDAKLECHYSMNMNISNGEEYITHEIFTWN